MTETDARESPPQPVYGSTEEWVTCHFIPMFRRPLGGEYRWCAQWWRHAEAITRLTALWHAWEALRLQPGTGMATWLRDHLDHQLPVLLGRAGPFAMCSEDEHIDPRPALTRPSPPGWWEPEQPRSNLGAELDSETSPWDSASPGG
jgi:hypothetical protein